MSKLTPIELKLIKNLLKNRNHTSYLANPTLQVLLFKVENIISNLTLIELKVIKNLLKNMNHTSPLVNPTLQILLLKVENTINKRGS